MPWWQIVLCVLATAGALVLALHLSTRRERFYRDYWRAAEQDQAWVKSHPGCTLEEAHQHRHAVRRRYHIWDDSKF